MSRNILMMKAILFEASVGNVIKDSIPGVRLIYDKKFSCEWLRRKETQIDIIAITKKAIYVIEVKDWSGYMEGSYSAYDWTGMGDSPKRMNVTSPIMQNLMHIRFIKSAALAADIKLPPLINLVCVPDSCIVYSECKEIVHLSDLTQRMLDYEFFLKKEWDLMEVEKFLRKCR